MTQTFEQQLQDLLNQEGGLEKVLSMYNGSPYYIFNALYTTHDIIVPQYYNEEHAIEFGFEDKDDMANKIEKYSVFEHIDAIMRELVYEEDEEQEDEE
jgi:hypothetical protein